MSTTSYLIESAESLCNTGSKIILTPPILKVYDNYEEGTHEDDFQAKDQKEIKKLRDLYFQCLQRYKQLNKAGVTAK